MAGLLLSALGGQACSRVQIHRGGGYYGPVARQSPPGQQSGRTGRPYSGRAKARALPGDRSQIVRIAKRYLGVPYRFGGKSPRTGFDCSGFTGYVYARAGMRIPGGARHQYRNMRPVRIPKPGDLVFFRTAGNRISHVGIYAGNLRFVHAPRTGKTVEVTSMRKSYWRKRYAGARTYPR